MRRLMKKRLFFGGVHPPSGKALSSTDTSLTSLAPARVVIPLRQHIGAPCAPLVSVGDHVLRFQKIGDGEGLCVPVHASVSGTVAAIEPLPHPGGGRVLSIVIDNDFRGDAAPLLRPEGFGSPAALLREAGIAGMGGAAFPTGTKVLSALDKTDTLIANACECEPYITADDTLLRTSPKEVLEGLEILRQILKPQRAILAIEDNKPAAIAALEALSEDFPGIQLRLLPTRYPQGSEKQLIRAVTRREVPPGKLPADVGCAVFNVSTCAAVFRAHRLGRPLTERIVTVTGTAVARPGNFLVPIGTPFRELIAAAGGLTGDACSLISGGPMMGTAQCDLSVPVIKATNCLLCLGEASVPAEDPVCIRCGKCLSVCPMGLQPLYLYRGGQADDTIELRRLHITDCLECGCCAYSCPGKLPLVETFRRGKQRLKEVTSP